MTYDKGDRVRLSVQFKTIDGVNSDPTTITISLRPPKLETVVYSYNLSPAIVSRTGTGAYYIDVDVNIGGVWRYKWNGTGNLTVAEEGQIFVRDSRV